MTSNSAASENHHAINIWEVKRDRLESMHQKISDGPRLLSISAGRSTCCIFRVPQSLVDINGRSYQPHIVSVGPYHHGAPQVQMIEEHKWRFLGTVLKRTQSKGLNLEDYLKEIQPLEIKARECYSEIIHFNTDEFIEMMVLDGCFIIELFRRFGKIVPFDQDDPLLSISWVYSFFLRDLLLLENQIPFFVLQHLFDLTKLPGEELGPSFATLVMEFFNNALQRPDEVIAKYKNFEGMHLLDFLRSSFIPVDPEEPKHYANSPSHVIHCVSKLRRAGISLKSVKADSFMVVNFSHGVIGMPTVTVDDFMTSFLLNCVAYEQCHKSCSKHVTTYATFLDCLVNSYRDVEYLCDRNIIENYFGTDGEVARFFNNMGKDVTFDIDQCYLARLFNDVNEYYQKNWHVQWASFQYNYFDTPWSFISALAAFILLVLTLTQTYFTVLAYVRPPA